MDANKPVVSLCVEGAQAELKGQIDRARQLYDQAWAAAQDDFEACIAAHYVARHQESPEEKLRWNQVALDKANAIADSRVQDFYPSLYLNMGHSFELLGNQEEAQRYYDLAAELGVVHQPGQPRSFPIRRQG
jgi:tetratricopeptide (TPR) repeat protein